MHQPAANIRRHCLKQCICFTDICTKLAGRSFSACRVFREPAFPYALFLLEELEDGPEGREGDDPADCRPGETVAAEQYGEHEEEDAGQEKNPPASFPEMIFSLDYQRVEQAYYQECTETDYNASEIIKIHNQNFSLQIYAEAERRANFICYAEAPQYMQPPAARIHHGRGVKTGGMQGARGEETAAY